MHLKLHNAMSTAQHEINHFASRSQQGNKVLRKFRTVALSGIVVNDNCLKANHKCEQYEAFNQKEIQPMLPDAIARLIVHIMLERQ